MATGTVEWFNNNKGFGFITPDGESGHVFVKDTELGAFRFSGLVENQRVSYEPKIDPKTNKVIAVNVQPL
ncbi:cold-shock protein [Pseudomonas sp. NPDC087803]|uniref:cold-shock protein n=1 Tax=Pseudomonas sp. NPDC087803 TaxID=3364448 RepID=UPI00382E163B